MEENTKEHVSVTVGLCVKDAERTIEGCLKSIINQSYPKTSITVIVVDGKSKDKTIEIIKSVLSDSGIRHFFLSDEGAGLGVARQIVFRNTKDKYIVWVDGDAVIHKDFIRNQVEFMEYHSRVCVATGAYIHKGGVNSNLPAAIESISKYVGSVIGLSVQAKRGLPPNDVSIYRVDALRQVNGFDINIRGASEDEDVIDRMRQIGLLVAVNGLAKYTVFPRETWQGLWAERVWFGFGQHFLGHKDKSAHVCIYHIPLINFYSGVRSGIQGYKLTSEKKCFLFPVYNVFTTAAWWRGYVRAHMAGYGHKITMREKN